MLAGFGRLAMYIACTSNEQTVILAKLNPKLSQTSFPFSCLAHQQKYML